MTVKLYELLHFRHTRRIAPKVIRQIAQWPASLRLRAHVALADFHIAASGVLAKRGQPLFQVPVTVEWDNEFLIEYSILSSVIHIHSISFLYTPTDDSESSGSSGFGNGGTSRRDSSGRSGGRGARACIEESAVSTLALVQSLDTSPASNRAPVHKEVLVDYLGGVALTDLASLTARTQLLGFSMTSAYRMDMSRGEPSASASASSRPKLDNPIACTFGLPDGGVCLRVHCAARLNSLAAPQWGHFPATAIGTAVELVASLHDKEIPIDGSRRPMLQLEGGDREAVSTANFGTSWLWSSETGRAWIPNALLAGDHHIYSATKCCLSIVERGLVIAPQISAVGATRSLADTSAITDVATRGGDGWCLLEASLPVQASGVAGMMGQFSTPDALRPDTLLLFPRASGAQTDLQVLAWPSDCAVGMATLDKRIGPDCGSDACGTLVDTSGDWTLFDSYGGATVIAGADVFLHHCEWKPTNTGDDLTTGFHYPADSDANRGGMLFAMNGGCTVVDVNVDADATANIGSVHALLPLSN